MRLSPWEPPRFLWAAVEGVCGLMLTTGLPRINPLVPASWKWVALRRLPYHGRPLSYFATRERGTFRIYATAVVESDFASEVYEEDVSDSVSVFSDTAAVVALRRKDEFVLLIANVGDQTANVPVSIALLLNADANTICGFITANTMPGKRARCAAATTSVPSPSPLKARVTGLLNSVRRPIGPRPMSRRDRAPAKRFRRWHSRQRK
jgi:hypothetical protein